MTFYSSEFPTIYSSEIYQSRFSLNKINIDELTCLNNLKTDLNNFLSRKVFFYVIKKFCSSAESGEGFIKKYFIIKFLSSLIKYMKKNIELYEPNIDIKNQ